MRGERTEISGERKASLEGSKGLNLELIAGVVQAGSDLNCDLDVLFRSTNIKISHEGMGQGFLYSRTVGHTHFPNSSLNSVVVA